MMYGTVFDGAANPIAGVNVTLENPALGFSRTMISAPDGNYEFAEVPPASGYQITATQGGKVNDVRSKLAVAAGEEMMVFPPLMVRQAGKPGNQRPSSAKLHSAEEVLSRQVKAFGGEATIRGITSYVYRYQYSDSRGFHGSVEVYGKAPNKILSVERIGSKDPTVLEGFNGSVAWRQENQGKAHLLMGKAADRLQKDANFYDVINWQSYYKKVEYDHFARSPGAGYHVLKFVSREGVTYLRYYEALTFLEAGEEWYEPTDFGVIAVSSQIISYRRINGTLVPARYKVVDSPPAVELLGETSQPSLRYPSGTAPQLGMNPEPVVRALVLTDVKINVELADSMFDPPQSRK